MITLFRNSYRTKRRGVIPPSWSNINERISTNIQGYQDYFRKSSGVVNSTNLISRIVSYYNTGPVDANIYEYATLIEDQSNKMASHFKLTSFTDAGNLFTNVFQDTPVAVMKISGEIPDVTDWENLEPLRVVSTTESSVNFCDLSKEVISTDTVYCELDTMMLMIMFREWVNKFDSLNINAFVYRFVIPNAFKNLYNLTLFNQLCIGEFIKPYQRPIPVPLIDTNREVLREQKSVMRYIKGREIDFETILKSIPVFDGTALDAVKMNYQNNGINNMVFSTLAKFNTFRQLILLSNEKTVRSLNDIYFNNVWFVLLTIMSSDRIDKSVLSNDFVKDDIIDYYEKEKS